MVPEEKLDRRYVLKQELGSGAMGVVWRAWDTRLERPVAIKVLRDWDPGEAESDSAVKEARLAGQLRHQGITVVHDCGWHLGQPFVVMELLDGTDLQKILHQHPGGLPMPRVLNLAIQAADALAAPHALRITHRDLKPANIMVLDGDRLKICDFGIAKAADDTQTLPGQRRGTPAYMSPEHFSARPVDNRSDLYSLGCVIYAMLTGHPPFQGDPRTTDLAELHQNTIPEAPQGIAPIPKELSELVLKLLAKKPQDRPQGAAEVAVKLEWIKDALAGHRSASGPVSSLDRERAKKDAARLSGADAPSIAKDLAQMGPAQAALTLEYVSWNPVPPSIGAALGSMEPALAAAALVLPTTTWSARFIAAMAGASAARVLEALAPETASEIIASLTPKQAATILPSADPRTGASWLANAGLEKARPILAETRGRSRDRLIEGLRHYPAAQPLVAAADAAAWRVTQGVRTALIASWVLAAMTFIFLVARPAPMPLGTALIYGIPLLLFTMTGAVIAMMGRFMNAAFPLLSAACSGIAVIGLLVLWSTGGVGEAMAFGGIANLSVFAGLVCLGGAIEG
ncbi:MAG TPA: serine/threonine-protein kinase [Trebonia sp.]|nr:serine/threonine-protein kinase [Trebonia sp.]